MKHSPNPINPLSFIDTVITSAEFFDPLDIVNLCFNSNESIYV